MDNNHTTENESSDSQRDRRIAQLEEQVRELTEKVAQQQEGGLPNVTRRQALGGLLGGSALLGTTGTASAQEGSGGSPWAPDEHDHSGADGTATRLGERAPVESIRSKQVNNDLRPRTATGIKDAIETAASGARVYLPTEKKRYEIDNPITVGEKVLRVIGGARSTSRGRNPRGHRGLLQKKNDAPLFDASGGSVTFENVVVSGLGNAGSTPGWVTAADAFTRLGMYNCRAAKCGGDGFHFENANTSYFANCQAHSNGGNGFFIGGTNANASTIVSFNGFSNSGHGIAVDGAYGTTLIGGYNAMNDGHGWYLNSDRIYGFGLGGEKNDQMIHIGADATGGFIVALQTKQIINKGTDVTVWDSAPNLKLSTGGASGAYLNLQNPSVPEQWESYVNGSGDYITENEGPKDAVGDFVLAGAGSDFANADAGQGLILTTPDGASHYRLRLDNAGTLVTEEADFQTVTGYPVPKQSMTIDGDTSELSDTPGLDVESDFVVYKRDPTLSGTVWVTWDDSNLYLAADLTDDKHTHPKTGTGAIYSNDVLDLAVAPGDPGEAGTFTQIDAAMTPEGPQVIKARWPGEGEIGQIDIPTRIVRNDETDQTVYEVAVPWSELPVTPDADAFSLGLAIRDVDEGTNKTGFVEWGSATLGGKDPEDLRRAELID